MSAELILYLIEQGIPLHKAKEVEAQEPQSTPELVLALIEFADVAISDARGFAEGAPPLTNRPVRVKPQNENLPPAVQTALQEGDDFVKPRYVPVVGADGLTDKQRAAVQSGVGLCPNCQQPKNAHLPGCARQSGEDARAVTHDPLPPAV